MSGNNRRRVAKLSFGFAGLGLFFKSSPAAAVLPRFPQPVSNGCAGNTGVLRYRFSTVAGETFSAGEQTAINARLAMWNTVRNNTNGAFNDVLLLQNAPPGAIVWTLRRSGAGIGGDANCGTRAIRLSIGNTVPAMANVAAHEVGHAIGLAHNGDNDVVLNSGDGDGVGPSIMSTCPGTFDNATFSTDDRAQVSFRRSNSNRSNGGFEQPFTDWRTDMGTSSEQTASPQSGLRYRRLDPGSTVVQQRIRIEVNAASTTATFHYKSSGSNSATFKMNSRSVNFPGGANAGCQWQDNLDYNTPTLQGNGAYMFRGGGSLGPASNWSFVGTTAALPGYGGGVPGAQDIELSFINNSNGLLFIDTVGMS